jgi:hypothetical protein
VSPSRRDRRRRPKREQRRLAEYRATRTQVDRETAQHVNERLDELHVGFNPRHPAGSPERASHIIVHRFSTDDAYSAFRAKLLGVAERIACPGPSPSRQALEAFAVDYRNIPRRHDSDGVLERRGVTLRHTQRSTTALFGAGLIDEIPDAVLHHVAREQGRSGKHVSGRVPPSNQGKKPGRFGWRGQTATLREFILTACAMEVGLQVPNHAQAIDPLAPSIKQKGLDLNEKQCNQLIEFVAGLPAPSRIVPTNDLLASAINGGEATFEAVGCAECHRRDMWSARGIYSDLLLHDMGPALADPVPANLSSARGSMGGYSGGSIEASSVANASLITATQEWRTSPLWGVRDSAPYLHDGRASTLEEAILWHEGEAMTSIQNYLALSPRQRELIVAFLNCLVAPDAI